MPDGAIRRVVAIVRYDHRTYWAIRRHPDWLYPGRRRYPHQSHHRRRDCRHSAGALWVDADGTRTVLAGRERQTAHSDCMGRHLAFSNRRAILELHLYLFVPRAAD